MPGNFAQIPPEVYLNWPKPNYVDPERRTWMPAFCIVWQLASTAALSPRLFLRAKKKAGSFGVDDVWIIVGWLFSIGFTVTAWLGVESFGEDRHTWDVPPSLWVRAALTGWVAQILFLFSTVASKLSVMLLYRRLVPNDLAIRWKYAIYGAILATVAYGIGIFIMYCLICEPLDAYWLSYNLGYAKPYKCIDGNVLIITSCVLSTLSDFYAVALPCALVRKYNPNVPRGQKIALNVMFALGLLVTGVGIGRTYSFWQVSNAFDTSWNGFELYAWAMVEVHLSIMCACAPSLRIFVLHYVLKKPSASRFQRMDSYAGDPSSVTIDNFERRCSRKADPGYYGLARPGSDAFANSKPRAFLDEMARVEEHSYKLPESGHLPEKRIATAEEYEMYAIAELSRQTKKYSQT